MNNSNDDFVRQDDPSDTAIFFYVCYDCGMVGDICIHPDDVGSECECCHSEDVEIEMEWI